MLVVECDHQVPKSRSSDGQLVSLPAWPLSLPLAVAESQQPHAAGFAHRLMNEKAVEEVNQMVSGWIACG